MGLLETLKASSSESEKLYFKTAFDHPGVGFCAQNGYEVNPVSFDTIQRVYKNYQKKVKNEKTKKNREKNKKNKIQLGKKIKNLVESNIARKNGIGEKRKALKSLEEKRQGIGHPRVYNISASEMKRRENEVLAYKQLMTEYPSRKDFVKNYNDAVGVLERSRENQTFLHIPASIHKLRNSITRSLYRVKAAQKEIEEQKKKRVVGWRKEVVLLVKKDKAGEVKLLIEKKRGN